MNSAPTPKRESVVGSNLSALKERVSQVYHDEQTAVKQLMSLAGHKESDVKEPSAKPKIQFGFDSTRSLYTRFYMIKLEVFGQSFSDAKAKPTWHEVSIQGQTTPWKESLAQFLSSKPPCGMDRIQEYTIDGVKSEIKISTPSWSQCLLRGPVDYQDGRVKTTSRMTAKQYSEKDHGSFKGMPIAVNQTTLVFDEAGRCNALIVT